MNDFNPLAFEAWNLAATLVMACMVVWKFHTWARSKLASQKIAAVKLSEHYDLVARIVDDPALPLSAVHFLRDFEVILSDKKLSERMIDAFYRPMPSGSSGLAIKEMESLSKSRPDLVETFQLALVTGVLAMVLRTAPSLKRFELFVASITDPKKEVQTVYRFVSSNQTSIPRRILPV